MYSMHLIFVEELPAHKSGKYAHYEHWRMAGEEWEYCDIRKYIGQNQERWLDQVDHWHAQLSRLMLRHTPWWWFMPASRLIAWYPPIFNPLFFAIAVIEYCETSNLEELYLVKCPTEVCNYIKELRPRFGISLIRPAEGGRSKTGKEPSPWKRYVRSALRPLVGHHTTYLRYIEKLIRLTLRCLWRNQEAKKIERAKLIVYSYVLAKNVSAGGGDHFFGNMFDHIPHLDKEDILWLYFSGLRKEKGKVDQHLTSLGFRFIILQHLPTFSDAIKIWQICIHLYYRLRWSKKELPDLKVNGYKSSLFTKKFFNEFVRNTLPIDELATYFAVKRLLENSNALAIVYPYEEKGLERALLRSCREVSRPVHTIGFAHALYNQGFLYLRNQSPNFVNSPRPDVIASTGPAARNWLIHWAHVHPDRIQVIGSPRYAEPLLPSQDHDRRQACLRVLILIGQGYELNVLVNYVEEVGNLFDRCELLIRKHPHDWDKEQAEGIVLLRKQLKNMRVEGGALNDQISWCDVAIFSSTSAGIEVMLKGRMAIYLELHNFFVLDPLYGKGDLSQVERCATPQELRETLTRIRKMSDEEYTLSVRKQREFAAQIYAPIDKKVIAQLVLSECDGECL